MCVAKLHVNDKMDIFYATLFYISPSCAFLMIVLFKKYINFFIV